MTSDALLVGSFVALSVLVGKEAFIAATALYTTGSVLAKGTTQTVKRFRLLVAGFLSLSMLTVAFYDISVYNQLLIVNLLIFMALL